MNNETFFTAVKQGLEAIPEVAAQQGAEAPQVSDIYVVAGHEKALNPDALLVVGDRGSGKSFWSAALSESKARALISRQLPRLRLDHYQVSVGFAGVRGDARYPSRQILEKLLRDGFAAESIWRAVILHQVLPVIEQPLPGDNWSERVAFIDKNPDQEEDWLVNINSVLQQRREGFLIVFDALDRLGSSWSNIRELTQGLLRVCLDMQGFSAIHLKLFMRPDMWEDKSLWAFPDASKLQHNQVMLEWRKVDLYGLLWHWLANREGDVGLTIRNTIESTLNCVFEPLESNATSSVYALPAALKNNEADQEKLLNLLSSPYMGTNRRRGKTYTWLPNHLSDAKGQVSPRSFLLAVKQALIESEQRDTERVLHYEGIKSGVIKASEIRLQELKEDYPWISEVLNPLHGLTVPAEPAELIKLWKAKDLMALLDAPSTDTTDERPYLPPYALEGAQTPKQKYQGLLHTLEGIGVLRYLPDGRVNIPDLYRVAAGIKRRGGVKAAR
jgi:hypothetical protein